MEILPFKITYNSVNAFNRGFSDYVLKIPYLNVENFTQKMIINNCTIESMSSICVDKGKIAGLCLCGADSRCIMINSFCVIPEYRGTKAAPLLMQETIKKANGRLITLEAIDKNIHAINFYKSFKFKKANDVTFMNGKISHCCNFSQNIRRMTFMEFIQAQSMIDVPVNWQNRASCLLKQNIIIHGYYENQNLLGFICYTDSGVTGIKQIYVKPEYRNRKIATELISSIGRENAASVMFIMNGIGEKFFEKLGFKEFIHLYEMTLKV